MGFHLLGSNRTCFGSSRNDNRRTAGMVVSRAALAYQPKCRGQLWFQHRTMTEYPFITMTNRSSESPIALYGFGELVAAW
jgi:hypothetical protein